MHSPRKPSSGSQESQQSQQSITQQSNTQGQGTQGSQSGTKQTTLGDFKKMILNKSMSSAGGNQRISAVEMLRASRPGIYGYSPPPAPVVKPPQPSPPQPPRGEGVIIPPSSRNTARALLFQSRFGSGRRFRTPKTEIISTTILEDHGGEVVEEEEEDEEDEDDSSLESPEQQQRFPGMRGGLARAHSEPSTSAATPTRPSSSPVDDVAHSTPNTTLDNPPLPPDVSIISPPDEALAPPLAPDNNKEGEPDEKESMETAL
ncbi:hypothetical protein Pmani_011058 [Petrolisthes manimaculis]|nr:hypothetical protein Pmani_011058 [Petrolisthes manimaculis]